jgi:hypothetical protein
MALKDHNTAELLEELARRGIYVKSLQVCGNCTFMYKYYFSESHGGGSSSWLACKHMNGYTTSVDPSQSCCFDPSLWEHKVEEASDE